MAPRSCSAYDSGHTPGNHLGRWAKPGEGCCGWTSTAWGMPPPIGEVWSSGAGRRSHRRDNGGEGATAKCVTHKRRAQHIGVIGCHRRRVLEPSLRIYPRTKSCKVTQGIISITALMGAMMVFHRLSRSVRPAMRNRWPLSVIKRLFAPKLTQEKTRP